MKAWEIVGKYVLATGNWVDHARFLLGTIEVDAPASEAIEHKLDFVGIVVGERCL
jgi:hypothetical protein